MTLICLSISSKVKCYTCHKVNRKAIYDLLYVFHTNFIWCTIYETQALGRSVTLIWEKVTDQFLRKCSKVQKGHNCYSDSTKSFLWYVVNVILIMPKKEKKLLRRFWDWPFPPPPPLKVAAAADTTDDDGRVGIWKAPLPVGTAELKIKNI